MSELPRVSQILGAFIKPATPFLLSKHLRRGRLTEAAATILAQGRALEESWWTRASGEAEDDRVQHEECRPAIDGVRKFLREHDRVKLLHSQWPVKHEQLLYIGHPDWLVELDGKQAIIDLKHGPAPTPDSVYDYYCRYQLVLYGMASGVALLANLHLYDGDYRLVWRNNWRDLREAKILVNAFHLLRRIRPEEY